MPLLEWSILLSTGIESIDEQHKTLLGIVNELNESLEHGGSPEKIKDIFNKLVLYTENHFKYEEELFEQYHYPLSEKHTEEHKALAKEIYFLKKKLDEDDLMINVELMAYLKDWLADHILNSDMAYSDHLLNHGAQ